MQGAVGLQWLMSVVCDENTERGLERDKVRERG